MKRHCTFPLCLLIHSNGKIKLTMEMYKTIPASYIVTAFWLKAAEIKVVNQVSWTIKDIPKGLKVPNVPVHTSSPLQMCACSTTNVYIFAAVKSLWLHC